MIRPSFFARTLWQETMKSDLSVLKLIFQIFFSGKLNLHSPPIQDLQKQNKKLRRDAQTYLYRDNLRSKPVQVVKLAKEYFASPLRSAHLEILGFPMGGAYLYRDIFARFKTMRRKPQNLASALSIQKEKWG